MEESLQTIVVYHLDDEETPYRSKLRKPPDQITLQDFKSLITSPPRTYKYFFKSEDADFGVVKEEINDDKLRLPVLNGRIEAWLVSVDSSSAHSDSTPSSLGILASKGTKKPGAYKLGVNNIQHSPVQVTHQRHLREKFDDESACTSDNESTVAGLPRFSRFDKGFERRSYRQQFAKGRPTSHPRNAHATGDDGAAFNSEMENTSMFDSDDEIGTKASFSTDITSVSRQFLKKKRNKRRRMCRPLASKASVISSITESSASLNIITVVLNIERNGGYLGISIVGHSDYPNGDGGIYVAGIMKGGAVALDGRIEPNDMILQVNEQSFHNLSNDEAVHYLQRVAKEPGPIKLIVAKSFNSRRRAALDDLDYRQSEPVQPIDPGAWVAHTNALALHNVAVNNGTPLPQQQQPPPLNYRQHSSGGVGCSMMMAQPPMDYLQHRPASAATASSNNSETWTTIGDENFAAMHIAEDCPNPELDFLPPPPPSLNHTPTAAIVAASGGSWAASRQTPPPLAPPPLPLQPSDGGGAAPPYSTLFPAPSSSTTSAGADLPIPSPVSRPVASTKVATTSQPPSSISGGSAASSGHSAINKVPTPIAVTETTMHVAK